MPESCLPFGRIVLVLPVCVNCICKLIQICLPVNICILLIHKDVQHTVINACNAQQTILFCHFACLAFRGDTCAQCLWPRSEDYSSVFASCLMFVALTASALSHSTTATCEVILPEQFLKPLLHSEAGENLI
jgi:hypothetical protein